MGLSLARVVILRPSVGLFAPLRAKIPHRRIHNPRTPARHARRQHCRLENVRRDFGRPRPAINAHLIVNNRRLNVAVHFLCDPLRNHVGNAGQIRFHARRNRVNLPQAVERKPDPVLALQDEQAPRAVAEAHQVEVGQESEVGDGSHDTP